MQEQKDKINTKSDSKDTNTNEFITADQNSDQNTETEIEVKYQNIIKLMNSINCMTLHEEKADMYKKTAKQFAGLSGYKDADNYAEECKLAAKQTMSDLKKKNYKKAKKKLESAKQPQDCVNIAQEFSKLGKYKDSEQLITEVNQLQERMEKKSAQSKLLKSAAVILCLAAFIFLINTSQAKYFFANISEATGSYYTATKTYKALGAYKDCPEKLKEASYLYAEHSEKNGNYATARTAYLAAGDYKDSSDKVVSMEKLILKGSKIGDKITIGNNKWYVIANKDNKALLIKSSVIQAKAYNNVTGNITWDKSSLHQWLNTDFIKENFSDAESKQIALTNIITEDNSAYGTVGGSATKDQVFIFSAKEIETYQKYLPTLKHDSWLRSPGNSQNAAAFLSMNGTIMNYGYEVTSDQMGVYPVMWYDYK